MKTVEGYEVDAKVLELLEGDEAPAFAARPQFATVRPGQHWDSSTLLTTDRRLVISRDRLIGRTRADLSARWDEVEHIAGQLWNGGGPSIQLLVTIAAGYSPIELIVVPQFAVEVESAIRRGYLSVRPIG